jgi:hypothetical protein
VCIVCDDAEPSICGVLFHYPAKSHLRSRGHGVSFVENDEFEGAEGGGCCLGHRCGCIGEYLFCGCESLDLFADNINATVVGGIQFQDHLANVLWAVDLAGECEDGRGFTCPRWTVEEEMRESLEGC